jgi:predicted dehydrogenase
MSESLQLGLIGAGYMGRAHTIAMHSVAATFGERYAVTRAALADLNAEAAARNARSLGFARSCDWRALLQDDAIDVIDICAPNYLHREMALAALAAGKHVYCEKPLATDVAGAAEVAHAAANSDRICATGFNYICNPMLQLLRHMVSAGELGTIFSVQARYLEDYLSDSQLPFSWRCERALAGAGALADLGSHLINLGHFLLGPIARLSGSVHTVHSRRLMPGSTESRAVENEDIAHALVEFANGVLGTMDVSRVASGYKCGLAICVQGTRGSAHFDQERMNELRIYKCDDPAGRRGFRTILAGPEHPDYAAFCPAPGHGLGINDLKVIELRNFLRAIDGGPPVSADFSEGLRVQQVMEAIEVSHREHCWVDVEYARA